MMKKARKATAKRPDAVRKTARRISKTETSAKASAATKTSKGRGSLVPGSGWRLSSNGGKTEFSATLLATHDLGDRHIVIFKSRR